MKTVLIIFAILILLAGIGLWLVGFFQKVEVVEREAGNYVVAGMEFTGPYHKVGPVMQNVDSLIRGLSIECEKGFGIYYDNPKTTPEDKLRSFVGNVIPESDSSRIAALLEAGLRVDSIQSAPSLVVELTTRNSMAYMVGPVKAYPALTKHLEIKGYKPLMSYEIYDMPAKKTLYVMQYSK